MMGVRRVALTCAFLLFLSGVVYSDTHYAASLSRADIQAAVDAASPGDTVELPAGTNTSFSGTVNITTDNLWMRGQGKTQTQIQTAAAQEAWEPIFYFNNVDDCRLSDMRLEGRHVLTQTEIVVNFTDCTDFQIFNCHMGLSSWVTLLLRGYPMRGIVYNCDFATGGRDGYGYCIVIDGQQAGEAVGNKGDASWAADLNFGAYDCVYVEDCTFYDYRHVFAQYRGSRVVIRYNTFTLWNSGDWSGDAIDTHGYSVDGDDNRGCRKIELYENTFAFNAGTDDNQYVLRSDSANWVIFNNAITNIDVVATTFSGTYNLFPSTPIYAYPNGSGIAGGWTPNIGTITEAVDDTIPDSDNTYIEADSADSTCEIYIDTPSITIRRLGHYVRVWAMSPNGDGDETINVYLYEGDTLRATCLSNQAVSLSSYTQYNGLLSLAEVDSINDFANLEIHIEVNSLEAGENIRVTAANYMVDCGPYPAPDQPTEMYLWGNVVNGGSHNEIFPSGGTDQSGYPYYIEDTNWFQASMPGYSPYAYPHPLRGGSGVNIQEVRGSRIGVNSSVVKKISELILMSSIK